MKNILWKFITCGVEKILTDNFGFKQRLNFYNTAREWAQKCPL